MSHSGQKGKSLGEFIYSGVDYLKVYCMERLTDRENELCIGNFKRYYALFSRKGFTKGLEELAKKDSVILFGINEVIKLLE